MNTAERYREDIDTLSADGEPQLSRRHFITSSATAIGAAALSQLASQEAQAEDLSSIDSNLEKKGFLVLPYSPDEEGKGILGASTIKPRLHHEKVVMSKSMTSSGGRARARLWLPAPINLGAARNVAQQPMLFADGKVVDPKDYEVSLVHTKPNRVNPYVNTMTEFNIRNSNLRARNITFLTVNEMIMPSYDPMTALRSKMAEVARAQGQQRMLLQLQALCQQYGYRTIDEFAAAGSVVTTQEFARVQSQIIRGLQAGGNIPYNADQNSIAPGCERMGSGDCGTRAVTAARASGGTMVMSVGFNRTPDTEFGGMHAINLAALAGNKTCSADCNKNGRTEFYPTSDTHLATEVGQYFEYDSPNFPRSLQGYHTHNNGAWSGSGVGQTSRVAMTSARGGLDPKVTALWRAASARPVDPDVTAKAKLQMAAMERQY